MSTSAEDFFGGNAKSASFDGKPGINWHGIIDRIGEQGQGSNPKKLYEADYQVNPNKSAGGFFQGGQQQAQQAAAAPVVTAPVASPFTNGAPQDNPANNWPPAGSIPAPAATAAPAQE